MQQYTALTAAIAQGVTEVTYGDKKVTYRSLTEMLRTKALMESELGLNKRKISKRFASFTKGLK